MPMQDRELYQQILGLDTPWSVADVQLDTKQEQVNIFVTHPRGTKFCCPKCQTELPCHDHADERMWRHLDSCQFKTFLRARIPRVKCPEHGVLQVAIPWAEPGSRFTSFFERFAIDVMQCTQTILGAITILRISWDQGYGIMKRAVARGQARKRPKIMPRVGIDEKAFAKGHSYITLLCDIDGGTVEAIADGRDHESARACYLQLTDDQLAGIKAVAMDMSEAYIKGTKETVPLAELKIVHDRFHIMQHATKAVDKVRRGEHKRLQLEDDNRLKKTKYIWLKSQENLSDKQREKMESIFTLNLQTGKAWGYKEALRDLWHHDNAADAAQYFKDWYRRVIHTKLSPMKKVAKMIKQRLQNVVSYCTHRITNAMAEGINSKIMAIKRRVGGYRNRENFKLAIFFYCGGLDLYPR